LRMCAQSRNRFRSKAGRSPRLSCAQLLGRRGTSFFGNAIGSEKFARYWCTSPGAQRSPARSFSECHRKWKIRDLDERRTAQPSTLLLAISVLGNAEFRKHHRDANFSGICGASPAEPRRIRCFERASGTFTDVASRHVCFEASRPIMFHVLCRPSATHHSARACRSWPFVNAKADPGTLTDALKSSRRSSGKSRIGNIHPRWEALSIRLFAL
jgi:hypothetical protein